MGEYTLYMDESETFNNTGKKYFVMSGVIIKDSDYSEIESKLNQVKKKVWDNAPGYEKNILHEKDVSFANFRLNSKRLSDIPVCYHIFQYKNKVLLLYNELSKLFNSAPLHTIGVCQDKSSIFTRYGENNLNNQLTISIQLLIEHYLQLADFVPNTLGRYAAMMKPKNRDFAKNVRSKLYDGKGDNRFGFKVLA